MDPGVQIPKVLFEILPVVLPRHTVHARCGARTDCPVRLPQAVDGHVMQKRGEPRLPVPSRHLAHAVQIT